MTLTRTYISCAILSIMSAPLYANDITTLQENKNQKSSVQLSPLVVKATEENDVGKTIYTKEDLEKTPNSSKNITDFLKVNPNVQFDREQRAASNQAELRPSEISINGAPSYRNKFVINGVNTTNNVDPKGTSSSSYNGNLNNGSQGIALNTDLICSLEVLDSNVSAEYGQFTGGVIKADTCAPTTEIGKIHGAISYDYTESDWARYNYANLQDQEDSEDSTQTNQKEFKKSGVSTNIYGKLSESSGFNAYFSKRESIIPVLSGFPDKHKVNAEKNNINLGGTYFFTPNEDTSYKFGFDYGNIDSLGYTSGRRDSDSLTKTETVTLFSEAKTRLDYSTLIQNLSYQRLENARENKEDTALYWGSGNINNTGPGSSDLSLSQNTFSYSLKNIFNPIQLKGSKHNLVTGLGYEYTEAAWERPTSHTWYNKPISLPAGQTCVPNDLLCDPTTNKYLSYGNLFKAGKTNVKQENIYFFLEDKIEINNFSMRLGARADYDSITHNLNFAPRSNFIYKPFNSDKLSFIYGWNRYYSNYTLSTELRENIRSLEYSLTYKNGQWIEAPLSADNGTNTRTSNLKTPYSDENVFGITHQLNDWEIALKWVNRKSKNEITRNNITSQKVTPAGKEYQGTDYYIYGNNGKSTSDIYTFTLRNTAPFKFLNVNHHIAIGFDYSESFTNFTDYTASFDANNPDKDDDRYIYYDGKVIRWSERPAENFNQPWTARLSWDMEFQAIPLKINNFFSYRAAYKDMISTNKTHDFNGEELAVYEAEKIKPRFSWDIRTTYDIPLGQDYKAIVGLTVNNVTNRNNFYTSSTISSSNTVKSEIGRQFIADITFKF